VPALPRGKEAAAEQWIRLKEQETSGFSPTWRPGFLSSRGKSGRGFGLVERQSCHFKF
jgi:hypothetical protein